MYKLDLPISNISLDAQYISLEKLALEAGFISNMTSALINFLPSVKDSLINTLYKINLFKPSIHTEITKRTYQNYFINYIRNIPYTSYKNFNVNVPNNYTGLYVLYTDTLVANLDKTKQSQDYMFNVYANSIKSIAANGPDALDSIANHTKIYKEVISKQEEIQADLSKYYDKRSGDIKPISELIRNNDDFKLLFNNVNKLSYGLYDKNSIDPDMIKKEVSIIIEVLNIIINNIKQNKHIYNSNDTTAIYRGSYAVAKLVETIGILYYDGNVVIDKIADMVKYIREELD